MATMTEDKPTEQCAPKAHDANKDADNKRSDASNSENKDAQKEQQDNPKPMEPAKKTRLIIVGSLVALCLIIGAVLWFIHSSTYEDTDDAQINGHLNSVAARIEGTVTGVYVENNHYVDVGQPLVDLDPKDYQVAYDQSNAQLLQAKLNATTTHPNLAIIKTSDRADLASGAADVASAEALIAAAQHDVAVAQAHLRVSEANNLRAQSDLARYKVLVDKDEVSQQQYDQYLASARAEQATVEADESAVSSAKQTVVQRDATLREQKAKLAQTTENGPQQEAIRADDIKNQEAGIAVAQSGLERNKLHLTYTHIVAPVAGLVMLRSAEIGDRVSVGQRLMQIVQIDHLWVDANFKETQLRKMHPGQKVTIRVDSLKEDFEGIVDAMPAATGDRASLFPAENATGNFVKVVQRLPVRIRLNAGQRDLDKLRPGMSVEPKVSLD
jgi:membrane fusion protein (multidrug efflux system)